LTLGPIGLYSLDMWLALRLATLFWEVGSCAVEIPSPSSYVTWVCFPLTLAGPLVRYSQFTNLHSTDRSQWKVAAWWLNLTMAAGKLAGGVALGVCQREIFFRWPQAHLLSGFTTSMITGPLGFYLTSAGYFNLMEVFGKAGGFTIPESFNYPIGRENISVFWMNWNMTATAVFRDYLFYNRWGFRGYNVYFNSLVLFALVGLWHAANAYWILWGALHGLLFCGFLGWRKHGSRLGRFPWHGTSTSKLAARAFTYVCVCACWYLPSKILQRLGAF
jgi:D-alanyl-lipoteichoic acid acyltransferase DltB (MBOAT superfamily)